MVISIESMFLKYILLISLVGPLCANGNAQIKHVIQERIDAKAKPSVRAAAAFNSVESLKIDSSSFDEATAAASKIGATASSPCSPRICKWDLAVKGAPTASNQAVAFLTTFSFKDGKLTDKAFAMQVGEGVGVSFVKVSEQRRLDKLSDEPIKVAKQSSNLTPFYRLFVWMTPATGPQVHKRYEKFAFHCLDGKVSCVDAKSLLPGIDW